MTKGSAPFRVVITRAGERADDFAELLRGIGAEPVVLPTIAFADPEDWFPVDTAIETLGKFDWVLFTSATAVDRFIQRVEHWGRMEALHKPSIAAVGASTKEALEERGVKVAFVPSSFTSNILLLEVGPEVTGKSVLLPRGDIADPALPRGLEALGADVVEVVAYRTVPPQGLEKQAREVFRSGVRLVCFTSPSTVKNLMTALGSEASVLKDIPAAVIGPTSAIAVHDVGLTVTVRAKQSTIAGLVESIREWKESLDDD